MQPREKEARHGKEDQGQGGPATARVGHVAKRDREVAGNVEAQRPGGVRGRRGGGDRLGGGRGDVGCGGLRRALPREGPRPGRLPGPRLGARAPRARPGRGHAQAAARGVPRRAEVEGRALHVLRPLLQALPRVHGEEASREPRRAQGRQDPGGRLGGADDVARRPRHGRGLQGLPVRGLPALQPPVLRRAYAGHERGYMASLPRARVRLHGRLDAPHGARQPQDRREGPPARGRGRAERGLSRDGRPLRLGGDAGARRDAARQAECRERGVAGRPGDHRRAAGRGLNRFQPAQEGRGGEAGGARLEALRQALCLVK